MPPPKIKPRLRRAAQGRPLRPSLAVHLCSRHVVLLSALEHPKLCLPPSFCTCWFLCLARFSSPPRPGRLVPASPSALTVNCIFRGLCCLLVLPPFHLPTTWCSVPRLSLNLKLSSLVIYDLCPFPEWKSLGGGDPVWLVHGTPVLKQGGSMVRCFSRSGILGHRLGPCFVVLKLVWWPCCIMKMCATPCYHLGPSIALDLG